MKFSMLRIRLVAVIIAVIPVLLASGCIAVAAGAAGAGTVAYIRGELDASIGHPIDAVDQATNRAAEQLRFAKINETADAFTHVITLRTADDKKIEIKLTRTSDALTQVRIRVGIFGNEPLSRALLDKIQANL